MEDWTQDELSRTLSAVIKRATVDPAFRSLALSDSKDAIARINPKALPNNLNYKFVDNSGPVKYVLLPDFVPGIIVEELSESELETVAGGIETGAAPPPPTTIVGG